MTEEQPKTKICKKCGQELPLEYFNKNRATKDGLQIYCKDCQKLLVKLRRERDNGNRLKIQELMDERGEMWEKKAEVKAYLEALPDSELITELRRRNYIGRIYKKIEVVL